MLGSCATRVCFRVDGEDARKLADEFAGFGPTDLMNLPDRQAIARLGPRDTACNLETIFVPTPPRTYAEVYPEILARTRARYCTPRFEIRAQLAELRRQIPPRRETVDPFAKLARGKEEETPVVPTASEAEGVAEVASVPAVALPAVAPATALTPEALPHFALAAEREHRVTQNFLRQLAGGRGWQSRLEAVLGGAGQLDVLLERGGRRLACEVAVDNQTRFEVGHLRPRLAAGLDFVLVVADDRGHRETLARRARQELAEPEFARVRFLGRDDVAAFLDELDQQDSRREEVVRDARVVHEQVALEPDARAESAAAVTAVIRRLGWRGGSR